MNFMYLWETRSLQTERVLKFLTMQYVPIMIATSGQVTPTSYRVRLPYLDDMLLWLCRKKTISQYANYRPLGIEVNVVSYSHMLNVKDGPGGYFMGHLVYSRNWQLCVELCWFW